MKAAIVILNWNGLTFLKKYLPQIISETPPDVKIVIADNGSTDESIDWIENSLKNSLNEEYNNSGNNNNDRNSRARVGHGIYNLSTDRIINSFNPGNLQIIRFNKNYGFALGYNKALELVEADYYVIMNSDINVPSYKELSKFTHGFKANWLEPILSFMDNNPKAGICMPKILSETDFAEKSLQVFEYAGAAGGFIDRYGFPFCRGRILSYVEKDTGQYDSEQQIFWASGACMIIRSQLYKDLGGFDASFFAHMEEIDLCWRAHLSGTEVWVIPQSKVYHVGGGTLPNNSPAKLYLNYRNNLLMLYKNLPCKDESWTVLGYSGKRNREWHIFIRECIDGLSAIAYLAQGKFNFFMAVVKAHRDYKKMRGNVKLSPRNPDFYSYTKSCNKPVIYRKSIILAFLMQKRRFSQIFK